MKKRILVIDGKEIEVTEEVYKVCMQSEWKEKKRVQRAYKRLEEEKTVADQYKQVATIKDGFTHIPYGLPLSLEVAMEEASFEPRIDDDTIEIVSYQILLEELLKVLSDLKERDRKIMKLVIVDELDERSIADIVGVSQKTVNNVKNRHFPYIQEKLKHWNE